MEEDDDNDKYFEQFLKDLINSDEFRMMQRKEIRFQNKLKKFMNQNNKHSFGIAVSDCYDKHSEICKKCKLIMVIPKN